MTTTLLKQATKLPLSDRIKLVEDIWNSIADEPDPFPLTKEQERELDRRLALMKKKSGPRAAVDRSEAADFETARSRKMMRGFTIQPEAADETNAAFNWYEDQQAGLGDEFYRELTRSFEFIVENPLLSPAVYRGLRKRKLNRFPYLAVYQVTDKEVSVVSVFHGSRNPAIWKRRATK